MVILLHEMVIIVEEICVVEHAAWVHKCKTLTHEHTAKIPNHQTVTPNSKNICFAENSAVIFTSHFLLKLRSRRFPRIQDGAHFWRAPARSFTHATLIHYVFDV